MAVLGYRAGQDKFLLPLLMPSRVARWMYHDTHDQEIEMQSSGIDMSVAHAEVRKRAKAFRLSVNEAWSEVRHSAYG